MCDPEVRLGIGLRQEPSLDKTRDWIERASRGNEVRAYAVTCAGAYVGNVVLDRFDHYLGTARLSVYIGDAARRGQGLGRNAVALAVQVGFEQLRLYKIWLTVHAENQRAVATYRAIGFVHEGTLRDEFLIGGRRLPALYMGLLRTEWRVAPAGGDAP